MRLSALLPQRRVIQVKPRTLVSRIRVCTPWAAHTAGGLVAASEDHARYGITRVIRCGVFPSYIELNRSQ